MLAPPPATRRKKTPRAATRSSNTKPSVLGRLIEWMDGGRSARSFECRRGGTRDHRRRPTCSPTSPLSMPRISTRTASPPGRRTTPTISRSRRSQTPRARRVLPVCARFEQEIAELDDGGARRVHGRARHDRVRIASVSFRRPIELLGLISFLTAGSDEVRAWTIRRGTKAPQAAGKIHTDFEKRLHPRRDRRVSTISRPAAAWPRPRKKALSGCEGKDYVMHDGDVTLFRFNVSK